MRSIGQLVLVESEDLAVRGRPQARYVKVVGTQFYEVATFGCDISADRGVIEGDHVALVGRVYVCARDSEEIETYPSIIEVSGGAADLRIVGETRVPGPGQ